MGICKDDSMHICKGWLANTYGILWSYFSEPRGYHCTMAFADVQVICWRMASITFLGWTHWKLLSIRKLMLQQFSLGALWSLENQQNQVKINGLVVFGTLNIEGESRTAGIVATMLTHTMPWPSGFISVWEMSMHFFSKRTRRKHRKHHKHSYIIKAWHSPNETSSYIFSKWLHGWATKNIYISQINQSV